MECRTLLQLAFMSMIVVDAGNLRALQPQVIEQTATETEMPASLSEQARAADMILRGVVTSSELHPIPAVTNSPEDVTQHPLATLPLVYTYYSVDGLEVLKTRDGLPPVTQVAQKVGEMRWGNYLIKASPGEHGLAVGDTYIMFLRWSEVLNTFTVIPNRAYMIKDSRVKPMGHGRIADDQRDRSVAEFVLDIRRSIASR